MHAEVFARLLEFAAFHRGADGFLEGGDGRFGRSLGGGDATPGFQRNVESLFLRGRHLRQRRIPALDQHGEEPDLPLLERCRKRARKLHHRVDVASQQAGDDLSGAERHLVHLGARDVEQGRERNVRMAADSGMPDADDFRLRLRLGDEFPEALPPGVRAYRDDHGLHERAGNRIERLVIESELAGVVGGRDRVGAPHQRIAVRLLGLDVFVADRAAGAGPVHHQHALLQDLRHAVGQHARGYVRGGACGEQHRDLDRAFLRISGILRISPEREKR